MTKGKFGILLTAIAVLSFVAAYFGWIEVLFILVGYAIIAEKNCWLNKQVFQALYLRLAYILASEAIGFLFMKSQDLLDWVGILSNNAVTVMSTIQSIIGFIFDIVLLVFSILAVINVLREKDASIPYIDRLTDITMGIIPPPKPKTEPQPQPRTNVQATPPVYPQAVPYTVPQTPSQQPAQTYQQPDATQSIPKPEEDSHWVCNCGGINNGNFCIRCGSKRP